VVVNDLLQEFREIVNNVLDRSQIKRIISHTSELVRFFAYLKTLWVPILAGAQTAIFINIFAR
jgi:acetone carboxylase gamma subunit